MLKEFRLLILLSSVRTCCFKTLTIVSCSCKAMLLLLRGQAVSLHYTQRLYHLMQPAGKHGAKWQRRRVKGLAPAQRWETRQVRSLNLSVEIKEDSPRESSTSHVIPIVPLFLLVSSFRRISHPRSAALQSCKKTKNVGVRRCCAQTVAADWRRSVTLFFLDLCLKQTYCWASSSCLQLKARNAFVCPRCFFLFSLRRVGDLGEDYLCGLLGCTVVSQCLSTLSLSVALCCIVLTQSFLLQRVQLLAD